MKKLKSNKGITLIALIITIIILLILATVSINIALNKGIIKRAQDTVNKYNELQINELEQLNGIIDEMDRLGNVSESKGEWWKFTEEEKLELAGHRDPENGTWFIAQSANIQISMGVSQEDREKLVHLTIADVTNMIMYHICLDAEYAKEFGEERNMVIEPYKWYYSYDGSGFTNSKLYTGSTSPIAKEGITNIYSESYLDRIIESFKK